MKKLTKLNYIFQLSRKVFVGSSIAFLFIAIEGFTYAINVKSGDWFDNLNVILFFISIITIVISFLTMFIFAIWCMIQYDKVKKEFTDVWGHWIVNIKTKQDYQNIIDQLNETAIYQPMLINNYKFQETVDFYKEKAKDKILKFLLNES